MGEQHKMRPEQRKAIPAQQHSTFTFHQRSCAEATLIQPTYKLNEHWPYFKTTHWYLSCCLVELTLTQMVLKGFLCKASVE